MQLVIGVYLHVPCDYKLANLENIHIGLEIN